MTNFNALVSEYIEIRAERLSLEKQAEEIKSGREHELKQTILQVMASQGMKSVNVEGLGRVVSKNTEHFEIADIEVLCFQMFKGMIDAAKEGRPLADALLLQRRAHADNLRNYMSSLGGEDEQTSASIGVRKVVKTDLNFTKG